MGVGGPWGCMSGSPYRKNRMHNKKKQPVEGKSYLQIGTAQHYFMKNVLEV